MQTPELTIEVIDDPSKIEKLTDPDNEAMIRIGDMLLRAYYPDQADTKPELYGGLWYEYGRLSEGSLVLFAKEADEVVGSLVMAPVEMPDHQGIWEVHGIAVDPDNRKQGIAAALYREFFGKLRESDQEINALVGITNNLAALNLWTKVCAEFGGTTGYGEEAATNPMMKRYLDDIARVESTFAFTDKPGILSVDPKWLPHNVTIVEISEAYNQDPDPSERFAVPVITTFD